jgi:hypothetical protein
MLQEISYYQIFGFPLILYGGTLTLICMLATASMAFMTVKGIKKFPLSWHINLAIASLVLGLVHGLLGLLAHF